MRIIPSSLTAIAFATLIAAPAHAVDQTILGSGLQVKNPSAVDPAKRKMQVKAKEKASLNTIVGNPVISGATLVVRANGTTPTQQIIPLPVGLNAKGKPFWSGDAIKGFKYKDAKLEQGAVKGLKIQKTKGGVFMVQANLSGKNGAFPLNVIPPNTGTDGCALLQITGGDSYSVKFAPGNGVIQNKGATSYSHKKVTTEGSCEACGDGIQNQGETGIDCGGPCSGCPNGGGCNVNSDCASLFCNAGTCATPNCFDGIENGSETDIDCGGACAADCAFNKGCALNNDCVTTHCSGGLCKCANHVYTFSMSSNSGGVFDSAEWPGGTSNQSAATSCSVTINRPSGNIDVVGLLGDVFSINNDGNYSSCFGSGGEDGDGCQPVSCPPAGVGSCQSARPSCSAALNGSGSAQYFVQCLE